MFVLRKIESERFETNEVLGRKYSLMLKKDYVEKEEQWNEILSDCVPEAPVKPEIYGIIYSEEFAVYRPLYYDVKYYVMSGDGSTFANLTHGDYYINKFKRGE